MKLSALRPTGNPRVELHRANRNLQIGSKCRCYGNDSDSFRISHLRSKKHLNKLLLLQLPFFYLQCDVSTKCHRKWSLISHHQVLERKMSDFSHLLIQGKLWSFNNWQVPSFNWRMKKTVQWSCGSKVKRMRCHLEWKGRVGTWTLTLYLLDQANGQENAGRVFGHPLLRRWLLSTAFWHLYL